MSTVVGDALCARGVPLCNIYGGTEFGAPTHSATLSGDLADGDWAYIRLDSGANIEWVYKGSELFECVFLVSFQLWLPRCPGLK